MIITQRSGALGLVFLEGRLEKDGPVVARMVWSEGPPLTVRTLLVEPEHRNQGLGKEMITRFGEILTEIGIPRDFENLTITSRSAAAPGLAGLVNADTHSFAMKMAEDFNK